MRHCVAQRKPSSRGLLGERFVTVTVPWTSGSVTAALTDVQGQTSSYVGAPTAVTTTTAIKAIGEGKGTVTLTIPTFADGDAYALTLTHSSVTPPQAGVTR